MEISDTGLTVSRPILETAGIVLVFLLACLVVYAAVPQAAKQNAGLNIAALREKLGLAQTNVVLFGMGVALWGALFVALIGGVFFIVFWGGFDSLHELTKPAEERDPEHLRWTLLTLAAVTGALSAAIALPFTLIRLHKTERQTRATEEGLVTDRLNKAVEGLGTDKVVKIADREETAPNLEVRLGAIYALERLARNNDDMHVQIMEILCAYIRENAPASEAKIAPELDIYEPQNQSDDCNIIEEDIPPILRDDWRPTLENKYMLALTIWLETLPKPRTDIQAALTVIGRRSEAQRLLEAKAGPDKTVSMTIFDATPAGPLDLYQSSNRLETTTRLLSKWKTWAQGCENFQGYRLDLSNANLRNVDLAELNFDGAIFDESEMQGASFRESALRGAKFRGTKLQGASFQSSKAEASDFKNAVICAGKFSRSRFTCAKFVNASIQLATFDNAWMDATDFSTANMQCASPNWTRFTKAKFRDTQMQGIYLLGAEFQLAWIQRVGITFSDEPDLVSFHLAGFRETDLSDTGIDVNALGKALEGSFGDGSVKLPGGPDGLNATKPPLENWSASELLPIEFRKEWEAWRATVAPPS